MPSPEPSSRYDAAQRERLLALAWRAIRLGREAPWLGVDLEGLPAALTAPGASFVSLHRRGALRGCMGSLEARRPLAEDVAGNARAAAFLDPRFPPVAPEELAELELEISVLGPARPLPAASEAELLAALRPGVDGLVLCEGGRRATYLPSVWTQLPDPAEFVRQLKRKAGLPPDYWSPRLRFDRYEVESIS
jgi:AmmeMemoRadiSam system protein A